MGFFDDLGKKVTDVGQKTVKKTKEMSETVKINSLISDEEKKLNSAYCQIGITFVSKYGKECEEEFLEWVNSALEAQEKIREYQIQIQDIKGIQRCEKCGATVQRGAVFCSACGAAMPSTQTENMNEFVQCKVCGEMVKQDMNFCTKCGSPMTASEETVDSPIEEMVENEKVCSNCGAKMDEESLFCTECGSKQENIKDV